MKIKARRCCLCDFYAVESVVFELQVTTQH